MRSLYCVALLLAFAAQLNASSFDTRPIAFLPPHIQSIQDTGGCTGPLLVPGASATFFFNNLVNNVASLSNVENGSQLRAACNNAANQWADNSALSYTDGGLTSSTSTSNNGVNLVTFANTSANSSISMGTIAVTAFVFNSSCFFVDTDIVFNPAENHSTLGTAGFHDVQAVATHEFGHAFGLSHSSVSSATMFAGIPLGSQNTRSLSEDDIRGINHSYPTVPYVFQNGGVSGCITKNGNPVYGAHVVARDLITGRTTTSTLSNPDGSYEILAIPVGPTQIYVEPLDGPSTDGDVISSFFVAGKDTNFQTTFFGGNASPTTVRAQSAFVTPNIDIAVPSGAPTQNLTLIGAPATPFSAFSAFGSGLEMQAGTSGFIAIGGPNVNNIADNAFSMPSDGVTFGPNSMSSGVFGGNAGGFKVFAISIASNAPCGLRDVQMTTAGETVVLCGGLDVLPPASPQAMAIQYGTSCASSNGSFNLIPTGGSPSLGNTGFGVLATGTVPGLTFLVLFCGVPSFIDAGSGCAIWVDPFTLLLPSNTFQFSPASNFTSLPLSIPSSPGFAGITFYLQALQQDPATPNGFVTSNGVKIVLN